MDPTLIPLNTFLDLSRPLPNCRATRPVVLPAALSIAAGVEDFGLLRTSIFKFQGNFPFKIDALFLCEC